MKRLIALALVLVGIGCGEAVDKSVDPEEPCIDGACMGGADDSQADPFEDAAVVIRNLNVTVADVACEAEDSCLSYEIAFVLENVSESPIADIKLVDLTLGDLVLSMSEFQCKDDWYLDGGDRSELLTANLSFADGRYGLSVACEQGVSVVSETAGERSPYMGTVELEMTGLLHDATLWSAVSSADVVDLR